MNHHQITINAETAEPAEMPLEFSMTSLRTPRVLRLTSWPLLVQ